MLIKITDYWVETTRICWIKGWVPEGELNEITLLGIGPHREHRIAIHKPVEQVIRILQECQHPLQIHLPASDPTCSTSGAKPRRTRKK